MRLTAAVPALVAGLAMTVPSATAAGATGPTTATPIEHVVVIFQENVSFDHYFGTYPQAANTDGQRFKAAKGTPAALM